MPDKRFWYIKIKALAASGQWEQLRQFANEKKSPVGYKPFAQVSWAGEEAGVSCQFACGGLIFTRTSITGVH